MDPLTDRTVHVAVKRVNEVQLAGAEAQEFRKDAEASMQREIAVLGNFRHPNMIRLLAYSIPADARPQDRLRLNLVYEYAAEGGLDGHLKDGEKARRLPWRLRVRILRKVASALHHLHTSDPQQAAWHRDVKSANIALTTAMEPKVIDCGLGKYAPQVDAGKSAFTRTGAVLGTPAYMCPKYATGRAFDATTEVFAFGCVIAEVLTGQLQNKQATAEKPTIVDHADSIDEAAADPRAGAWPGDLVAALRALAGRCLADKPKDRPSTMLQVLRELHTLERTHCPIPLNAFLLDQVPAQETETCLTCFADVPANMGVECFNSHFQCAACFDEAVQVQASADYRGALEHHGAVVVCAACQGRWAFDDDVIRPLVSLPTWKAYQDAKQEVEDARAVATLRAAATPNKPVGGAPHVRVIGPSLCSFVSVLGSE